MTSEYIKDESRYTYFAKEIFSKYFPINYCGLTVENFDSFYHKLNNSNKEKLLKISFFYYFRGWKITQKPKWYEEVCEDFVLVTLISIAEAILSDREYVDLQKWLKTDCGKKKD